MTAKIGISLPDSTYARAVEFTQATGMSMSGLVDAALRAEITRRELGDHLAMLAQAEDPERLRDRARARSDALRAWKRTG
ncbi:MAG: hypothetical protein H0V92_00240 [Pseudonocardiales bacterium]|nr:hypothetical protein [Pseudonocardiales bacterium]